MARIDQRDAAERAREYERLEAGSLRAAAHALRETFGPHKEFPNADGSETFVVKIAGPSAPPRQGWRSPLDTRPVPQGAPLEVLAYRRLRDGSVSGAFFAVIDDRDHPAFPDVGAPEHPFSGNWAGELSNDTRMGLLTSIMWELVHGLPEDKIFGLHDRPPLGHQR
ncbi:MAG TPA: hypothetical protein VIF43_01425 [Patescibacteria group bacterium]|jgi:hypothetical protein